MQIGSRENCYFSENSSEKNMVGLGRKLLVIVLITENLSVSISSWSLCPKRELTGNYTRSYEAPNMEVLLWEENHLSFSADLMKRRGGINLEMTI